MEPTTTETGTDDAGPPSRRAHGSGRTVLVLTALASLVVGGIIGGVIGWQVQKNRVEDDIANIRPIGTITAVSEDAFTVELRTSSGSREFTLTDATIIETAESGTAADLTEGATVLVRSGRSDEGDLQAAEVIVLPSPTPSGG
jgi:Domain of unknown function (DUF5666)